MITHKITKQTSSEVTLTITAGEKFIAPYKQAVLKRLKKNLKVDGFRPGNVPDNIAERELGEQRVQAEVLEEVIMHAYSRAVREEKLETIATPQVSLKKFVPYSEVEFEAEVAIMPEVKLDLSKLKVSAPEVKVAGKEIDETLQNIARQSAIKTDSKKPIEDGDEITFDFSGEREGKPVEGASATGHVLTVGEGSFIPGFEENLIGLKVGEKKTFGVTFPAEYHAKALAGKKVTFKVKISKIQKVQKPTLDDAWAKTVGPVQSLKELRAEIEKSLHDQKLSQVQKDHENEVIEGVLKLASLEVPKSLVSSQQENLKKETEQNLQNSGLTIEKYIKMQGQTQEEFDTQLQAEAQKRVSLGLVLRHIIEQQKITVTEQELEAEMQKLKAQYTDPKMQEELTHDHFADDLRNHLLTQKAIAYLVASAK